MNIPRRRFIHLAGSAAALLLASRVRAQTYPTRPVRVIVPFAPGGPADIVARLLTQKLGDHLGRQFYVENVAGAGGNLGMRAAARAAPDGYTLVLVSSSYMVNPSLYPHVPYDPAKDFVPVTLPAYAPNVLVASPSLPVKSVEQLAEFVKANPGKLSFASAGMGTTPYLSGELFKLSLGADLVHVPFNGSAPAIQSTLGGHTQFAFVVLAPAVPHIREGSLRGLAVLSAERSSALPDVPTIAEAGVPGYNATQWLGFAGPKGLSNEVVTRIFNATKTVVENPEIVKSLRNAGGEVSMSASPKEFLEFAREESVKWARVVKESGAQVN